MNSASELDVLPEFEYRHLPEVIDGLPVAPFLALISVGIHCERDRLSALSTLPGAQPELVERFRMTRVSCRRLFSLMRQWPQRPQRPVVPSTHRLEWTGGPTCYFDGVPVRLAPQARVILAVLVQKPNGFVHQDDLHAALEHAKRRTPGAEGRNTTLREQVLKCFTAAFVRAGRTFDGSIF